jgi:exodeoxyribonuclease VII small subunit
MCNACRSPEAIVTTRKPKTVDFEQALGELESVVAKLEHGELPLEEALKQFERGIELARGCQASLKQAEQRVEILLAKTPDAEPEPFDADE